MEEALLKSLQNPNYQDLLNDKGMSLEIVVPAVVDEAVVNETTGTVDPAASVFPGSSVPKVSTAKLNQTRTDAQKFASVGSTLGTGYKDNPPEALAATPLSQLIRQGSMLQYTLMQDMKTAVGGGNTLTLNQQMLGSFGDFGAVLAEIVNVFVTIENPHIQFAKCKPGVIGTKSVEVSTDPAQDSSPATPEDHVLKVTGDASLLGLKTAISADFFQLKGKPNCALKFVFKDPMGIGSFFPGFPILSGMQFSAPTFVASTASTVYDASLDKGINSGFNFFGTIEIEKSKDKQIKFLDDFLHVKSLDIHAGASKNATSMEYVLEAAVNQDITIIDGKSFSICFTKSEIGISVKGRPPEPAFELKTELVVKLTNKNKETRLVFTGGLKIEPESITGAFTMDATGPSPESESSPTVVNTGEWKNPFGIPGITIRQLAFQLGCSYVPPWIDNVGIHGNLRIGDVDGSISILVDANDPDQFVLAGSTDRLTLLQLLSAMSPPTFVAYQLLSEDVRAVMNKVVDISLENVRVNIVPTACSIGEIQFRDEGVTVMGRLNLWGWHASAYVNVDANTGITVRGDMDPIDVKGIFKVTGAQGDPAPALRFRLGPHEAPDLYISAKLYLLGISKELKVTADKAGFTFFLRDQYGEILTTQLACQYHDYNFRANGSIDFKLNVTLHTVFGDIPLVDTGLHAQAELRVGKVDGFYASLGGSFEFYGSTLTMPTLTVSVTPTDFQDLFFSVVRWLSEKAEEIFGFVWKTLKEFGNAIKNKAVYIAGEIAEVAKSVYHATEEQVIALYNDLKKGATELARGMKKAYLWTMDKVAKVLKELGYWADEATAALQEAYNATKDMIRSALEYAQYTWDEIENGLKFGFTAIGDGLVTAGKTVGNFVVHDVGGFFKNDVAHALGA